MKRNKSTIILVTAILGTVSVALAHHASAITYQDSTKVEFTFNPTINVSLSSSDLTISNLAPGGTSDSNVITATVSTNAGYGYYLSATTGTAGGNANLTNTADSTYNFASLSSNVATLSAIPDNKWGYSYSTDNGTTWISGDNGSALSGYNGLPLDADDSGATGVKLLSSDSFATSGSVQFKIGARASSDQAAGTYTGTVNFYAVTNPKPIITIETATTMQEVEACPESVPLEQIYTLKDSRDNTEYHTARLADGNCWLLDNLALDLTSSTVLNGMNENNTHASNTTLNYLKNGGGTTSDKYATTGVVNWTDSPTYASRNSYSDPLVNLTNKDVIPSDATSQAGQYKVGGYYNYCAASAGSYCYGNGGTSYGTSSGNATEDICPKGWRMPTGDTTGEYQALYNNASYNTYANYRSALHLPLSGYFSNGSASNQGSNSLWWSSTRFGISRMYRLDVNTSSIYPSSSGDRYYGNSVRCVLGS